MDCLLITASQASRSIPLSKRSRLQASNYLEVRSFGWHSVKSFTAPCRNAFDNFDSMCIMGAPDCSCSVGRTTPRASHQLPRWHDRSTRPVARLARHNSLQFIHTRAAICQLTQLTSRELLLRSTVVPCERGVDGS